MRFHLLGPLGVQLKGMPVRVSAHKQRTVLAMLLAHAGRTVPIQSLVAEVWDERPPRSAVPNVHTYVMRLRHLLSAADPRAGRRLVTSDGGYLLQVDPPELDLFLFEELLTLARKALVRKDLRAAEDAYERALGIWRGTAAQDVPLGPVLRDVVAQLTDRYLSTVEEHLDVRLALGSHRAALDRLRELTRRYPLRERLHAQSMVALYRCGDVTGALEAFATARRVLAHELGLDPGAEMRRLHRAILDGDPVLDGTGLLTGTDLGNTGMLTPGGTGMLADTGGVTLDGGDGYRRARRLPPEPSAFVGRRSELARANDVLYGAAPPGSGARVIALHGAGGVGTSALALHLAHRATGRYTDGRLYVDLRGSSPGVPPLRPADALGGFLRALGVPGREVPATTAEAAAAYRSLLAGRRVLVILDNAADAAQVTPLLPASDGCAALITSRTLPATVDAVPIAVGMLDETDAVRLLRLLVGESRVAAEPEAAADVARWCGYHPLALHIAGTRLASRPNWSLRRFGERLRDRRRRLDVLQAPGLSIRSCFQASYGLLTDRAGTVRTAAARACRLLGVLDLPEVGIGRTAALLDVDPHLAEAALDELTEFRLLEPAAGARFRMHDLVRLVAAELSVAHDTPEERARALRRARP
ncbi:AfsR/SARP family transcriptional regulator [Nonomuraea glycinis]|uniref:AfsR/SARP family transcriptional regulator n=1 Tax=Nonomuraea glycinis TaxID=2047744 RepID=UPI002E0E0DA6|nr:winged helix-turn-helix domain-containing protein [Nonomuraea glycinis]